MVGRLQQLERTLLGGRLPGRCEVPWRLLAGVPRTQLLAEEDPDADSTHGIKRIFVCQYILYSLSINLISLHCRTMKHGLYKFSMGGKE